MSPSLDNIFMNLGNYLNVFLLSCHINLPFSGKILTQKRKSFGLEVTYTSNVVHVKDHDAIVLAVAKDLSWTPPHGLQAFSHEGVYSIWRIHQTTLLLLNHVS